MKQLVLLTLFASVGIALSAKGKVCGDGKFGGCDKSRGLCWEANSPKPATTFCTCKAGYTFLYPKKRKGTCVDINECKTGAHSCDTTHGKCVNTIGSHYCTCNAGYVLDYTKTHCLLKSKISGKCKPARRHHYYYRKKRAGDEPSEEFEEESTEDNLMKDKLLSFFLQHENDEEKSKKCGCEAGFRRCSSGYCKDINECKLRKSKCDLRRGHCHNTFGGYFCSCKKGYLLGPCGYKCYHPKKRPGACTSTNLMANTLVRTDSDGRNDEATLALIHDIETEKSAAKGKSNRAIPTLQGKKCKGSGTKIQRFDVNRDGKIDVIIHLSCKVGKWIVRSTFEKEAKWDQWTCWTECKATCHGGIQTRTRYCKNGLVGEGNCKGAATQHKTCYSGKKCPHRIRRDSSTLTTAQKCDFVEAFKKYKADTSTNGFWAAGGTHFFPSQCVDKSTGNPAPCCYHGARLNFAIWHRAELLNIEEGLSRYMKDKTLGLPYWNWLKENKAPDFVWSKTLNGKPNPLAHIIIRHDLSPPQALQRDKKTQLSSIVQARNIYLKTAMKLMESHTLHEFSEELENAHNWIHTAACPHETSACTFSMGQLTYAAYDPLFFMHHTNVDRQIARLQHEMAKKGETAWTRQSALEPQENIYHFNEPYNPFRNKTLTAFKRLNVLTSMQDLFYYDEMLGYKYDTLEMHGGPKLTKGDAEVATLDSEKEHLPQGADAVNIMQYERSVKSNVKIAYYVENPINHVKPIPASCAKLSEKNPRFVASALILGSKGERPWVARQPVIIPMAAWIAKIQVTDFNQGTHIMYKIRACYTHQRSCTKNCPGVSPSVEKLIPSPQLMFYPKNIREDLLRFEWDTKIRMPSFTINVKSATQWLYFWGKEMANVVQVPNKKLFNECSTAGSHSVTCTGSCILPTGYHYFIHKNKTLCKKGLRLSILSSL